MRFRVALSYPGERRSFVALVADGLAETLGRESVLYDKFHEAEFARFRLSSYLQNLYHDESELIVVFLSAEYQKEWCGLEWDAVLDLVKRGRESSVMLLRFDAAEFPGLFSTAGHVWIGERSPEEMAAKILERLDLRKISSPQLGPSPADPKSVVSRLPQVSGEVFGRKAELAWLEDAWRADAVHLAVLVAWGGTGKTALVADWVARLADREFDGADYFDWSFYSQGSRDQSTASADAFIDAALRFFGDEATADSTVGAWEKGVRLAGNLGRRRALLVFDGLEPLQHPPGPLAGELKDPALKGLLRGLAAKNAGLCVVTTREAVPELVTYFRRGAAREMRLDRLSAEAGVELLRSCEIQGTRKELEKAVEETQGHALTLSLLGSFLKLAHDGDIARRDLVRLASASKEFQGDHAFRVMSAYELWLEGEGLEGRRQLSILRLLGLFDRPAAVECLNALRQAPEIIGLTDSLFETVPGWKRWLRKKRPMGEEAWKISLSRLVQAGLVYADSVTVDAHPLIREYFASRLQGRILGEASSPPASPRVWREAHSRIFDFLCERTEYRPNNLAGLQPLYQAVYHGCQAGGSERHATRSTLTESSAAPARTTSTAKTSSALSVPILARSPVFSKHRGAALCLPSGPPPSRGC